MVERNTVNLKDISDDQIVFDYVAGHLSEQERVRFEDDLRHNESLAKKVDSERELRRKLTEYERQAPALNADENAIEDLVIQINDFETNHKILSFIQQPKVYISAAACLMVAIAVSMFEPAPSSAPEFELLSNNKSVMTVDFDTLIESKQLAKLSLIGDLSEQELATLFEAYELTPVSRSASGWVVRSAKALSTHRLETLRNSGKFSQVDLISYPVQKLNNVQN